MEFEQIQNRMEVKVVGVETAFTDESFLADLATKWLFFLRRRLDSLGPG